MVLMSFITNLWMFYGAFLIISFGASGASHGISWPVVIVNWFQRLRGRALGLACMGPVVSGSFLVTIAMLEDVLGWRACVRLFRFLRPCGGNQKISPVRTAWDCGAIRFAIGTKEASSGLERVHHHDKSVAPICANKR